MRFIDLFTAKKQSKAGKYRIADCPYSSSCSPISFIISKANGAGVCAGLIHTAKDLDCIRLCLFYREIMDNKTGEVEVGELKVLEHFMTPDEAISTAKVLLSAVDSALEFSSDYQRHFEYLDKIRAQGNGDKPGD